MADVKNAVWAVACACACATGCVDSGKGMMMKTDEVRHGFRVTGVTELPEVQGRLWRMTYEKNGAELAWLERADDNKTFGIAFKTLPGDDTGVAHILEHSVLCGSRKYPVKEPFVDLLKSSLATFLNAMTYPDKTVYPVSSRNEQDFLNLTDVYLDAVFHPLSVESPLAFEQEGWHYELEKPDGELKRNGVVYSEMKGVFARVDSVVFRETMQALFPDNAYGFESGGDPLHIPELTFEKYKAFHARFYHPSNARIFLDGAMDADKVLAKLDSFLSDYGKQAVDATIVNQKPVVVRKEIVYEIGPEEDETNKVILADSWVIGTFDDRARAAAFTVLSEVLAGSNESPLKKALLDRGLCEDVEIEGCEMQQNVCQMIIRNTAYEKTNEIRRVVRETLEGLVKNGLDRKQLAATLDHLEFTIREKDTGTYPRGIAFCEAALGMWLYGGDPAESFRFADLFAGLRAGIETGLFEKYLREMMLENPHHAELVFTPSKKLGEERRANEKRELAAIKAAWSKDEVARVVKETQVLKDWQNSKDKPEDTAKLPVLALKDIPEKGPDIRYTVEKTGATTVVRPTVSADGIFYLELHFAVGDLTDDELKALPFLTELLGELSTAEHDALALKCELDGKLGRFNVGTKSYVTGPDVTVFVSALQAKKADALRLVREVLLTTKFDDQKAIADIFTQSRQDMELAVADNGRAFAMRRALAPFSDRAACEEMLAGMAQLRYLQQTKAAKLQAACSDLARRVFTRNRLTVALSDNEPIETAAAFAQLFPGADATKCAVREGRAAAFKKAAEGFVIPGDVAFAGKGNVLAAAGAEYSGVVQVAARYLTLDYLWREIRVLGGAYGMGLVPHAEGDLSAFTYRDPQPMRSLGVFDKAGAALATFAQSDAALDKYIISAIGRTEPYLTPRLETQRAIDMYLSKRTPEDAARVRREILSTTKADLASFAKTLDALAPSASVCVVGGKAAVAACSNVVTHVEAVAAAKGE